MDERFLLHLGDCFDISKAWPDKVAYLMLTDPPYGISVVKRSNRLRALGYRDIEGDNSTIDIIPLLRLAENSIIFGGNYFKLPISSGWVVWDKQGDKKVDFGDCELVWTSYSRPSRIITHIWDGFRRDSEKGKKRVHPAQKPVELLEDLIRKNTLRGDIVFDPFMGSGSVGVAAVRCGRKFIGCEIDSGYYDIAKKRIEEACMQDELLQ